MHDLEAAENFIARLDALNNLHNQREFFLQDPLSEVLRTELLSSLYSMLKLTDPTHPPAEAENLRHQIDLIDESLIAVISRNKEDRLCVAITEKYFEKDKDIIPALDHVLEGELKDTKLNEDPFHYLLDLAHKVFEFRAGNLYTHSEEIIGKFITALAPNKEEELKYTATFGLQDVRFK